MLKPIMRALAEWRDENEEENVLFHSFQCFLFFPPVLGRKSEMKWARERKVCSRKNSPLSSSSSDISRPTQGGGKEEGKAFKAVKAAQFGQIFLIPSDYKKNNKTSWIGASPSHSGENRRVGEIGLWNGHTISRIETHFPKAFVPCFGWYRF